MIYYYFFYLRLVITKYQALVTRDDTAVSSQRLTELDIFKSSALFETALINIKWKSWKLKKFTQTLQIWGSKLSKINWSWPQKGFLRVEKSMLSRFDRNWTIPRGCRSFQNFKKKLFLTYLQAGNMKVV